MAVANNLAANKEICSLVMKFLISGVISQMIPFCSIHKPNSVTTTKDTISYLIFLLVDLNVYFLLAKKLKTKAVPVETVLATSLGSPIKVSKNNRPKSIIVFTVPTIAKRPICALFFTLSLVIFLNKVSRSVLGLAKYSSNVLADNTQANQLDAA